MLTGEWYVGYRLPRKPVVWTYVGRNFRDAKKGASLVGRKDYDYTILTGYRVGDGPIKITSEGR